LFYNRNHVDELREDIQRDEYAIKMGYIKESQLPQVRDRLRTMQNKLDEIENSIPKLSSKKKDELKHTLDYLGEEIKNKMFTRTDMMKGIADSHEEAKRMVTPSITVTPEVMQFAKACNVQVTDGKISRDGASKIWKIGRRVLDENSDAEELRRD
jgi:predicted nuclease with TOPRIM domain